MHYNDYNRSPEEWGQPAAPYPPVQPPQEKKKRVWPKVLAFCLACALIGGGAGAGGALLASRLQPGGTVTLYQGQRSPEAVNVTQVTGEPLTADQIYERCVGSVVGITTQITTNFYGQQVSQAASGSGFVISQDGYILTNHHVIENATTIQVSFYDGSTYDAKLVGSEPENDVAVLKIKATGLTPVVLANSDNIKVGEGVVAIGNPLGELTFTMTDGILSARDRTVTITGGQVLENMMQTNAAINSGNSGGPLFDMYGQVIGITTAKPSSTASSNTSVEGLGFAIPINDIMGMVQDIIKNGYVTGKPYLGIKVSTVPESVAEQYGVSPGARVEIVYPGFCAANAGLQVGDIITAVDGEEITSHAQLIELKNDNYKAGDTMNLTVSRNGEKLTVSIVLDEDNPELQERLEKLEEQQEQKEQQEQQQQENSGSDPFDFFWPFGNATPWYYN